MQSPIGQSEFCGMNWGDYIASLRWGDVKPSHCVAEGCDRPTRNWGLCNGHYQRLRNGKDLSVPIRDKQSVKGLICAVDGCSLPACSKQFCRKHYQQLWKGRGVDEYEETRPTGKWWEWARRKVGSINDLRKTDRWLQWANCKASMARKRHKPRIGWKRKRTLTKWIAWADREKGLMEARERRNKGNEWQKWAHRKRNRIGFRTRPKEAPQAQQEKGHIQIDISVSGGTKLQLRFDWAKTDA
jgi:hypothetical protein